ncbi:MAG: hypothetical protein JKY51_02505, partial [Opitutaceae bacterium]|nr:hypothetical protein [Opitutaceae bacterium]
MSKKLLHLAGRELRPDLFTDPFIKALQEIGELEIVTNAEGLSESELVEKIQSCQVLLTGWDSVHVPASIAESSGELEYI